ncbi:MAG TPA: hypothetical protein ENI49_05385 [Thermoplasmatales archaeon]|nr:hypothetical protein [Thermoplasmatales archaeon]
MANLFWKTKQGTKILLAKKFKIEEEFEKNIFETPEILEDIFLIKRQIRGGKKRGIPDIVGIDNDGNICIVEMKNEDVDSSIIPQVLEYAIWAEQNPDSIKSLWLEIEDRPEELYIDWDNLQIRIIIIAPNILMSTIDAINRINYPVDLIEIKRWIEGDNQFLLVNKLEEEKKAKIRPVSGLPVYDREFYEREYNKNSVKEFFKYINEVENIIKERGWSLETKYNKHHCSFKVGFFNAFGIKWETTKTLSFFFKLSKEQTEDFPVKMTKYEDRWKEAVYYIEPGKTKTKDFIKLFEIAYNKLTGE